MTYLRISNLTDCFPEWSLSYDNAEKTGRRTAMIAYNGAALPTVPRNVSKDSKGIEVLVSKSQLEDFFKRIGHFQANMVTDDMVKDLNRVLQKYKIDTPSKISMFMATIGHESKTGLVEGGVGNKYVVNGVDYRGGGYSQMTGYKFNYKPFADQMEKEELVV